MKSISEKLNLNSKSNVIKSFKEMKQGDEIYIWWQTGYNDGREEQVNIFERKINAIHKLDLGHGYDPQYIFKHDEIGNYRGETHFFVKTEEIDQSIIYCSHNGYMISTDQTLLEKFIDDEIDKFLKPYQDEFKQLQDKINKVLTNKANKIITKLQ